MKKVGIVPNILKDFGLVFTKEVIKWLETNGCQPMVSMEISFELNMTQYGRENIYIYENSDFLLVLGGDGTILRVVKNSVIYDIPILGVNLGTMGYLTDVEKNEAFVALKKVISNEYKLEKRMMLEAVDISSNSSSQQLLALNEVCISKGVLSSMVSLELEINGEYIDEFKTDGLIISTPTGSTAYNLSAGGSVLKPDVQVVAITPVCPHMISARPLVVSADDSVKITITGDLDTEAMLFLDGQNYNVLEKGSSVTIRRSKYFATIMKTNNKTFYDILRHKIR